MYKARITSAGKQYISSCFDGGINKADYKTDIADNQLADCKNMWFNCGFLKTRDGLKIKNRFSLADSKCTGYATKLLLDNFYTDSNAQKVFLLNAKSGYDTIYKLLIVRSDATRSVIPLLTLHGIDYDYASVFANCVCFVSKPTFGSGIYVLAGITNSSGEVIEKYVYELSNALDSARRIGKTEIYSPLVYVNGKGNKFNTLEQTDITYPKPMFAEEMNALCSSFRVAFKTDGVSNMFNLPFRNLSNFEGEKTIIKFKTKAE